MSLKTNDEVVKQQILDEGFESLLNFGNCIVFTNQVDLIFWNPRTRKIETICPAKTANL
jgi:hypothetical protein